MPMIREQAPASQDASQCPQPRSAGNQEHDHEWIFHGVHRFDTGKDLAGHHARQRHEPDRAMPLIVGIKPLRSASRTTGPRPAQRKAGLDRRSFAHQAIAEHI